MRVAGHPLHASAVHLPMGAFLAVAVWDGLALVSAEPVWWLLAYYSLGLGLVSSVPAAISGFLDFVAIPNGHRSERVGYYHLGSVLTAVVMYLASSFVRGGGEPVAGPSALAAVSLSGLGLVCLLVGGWLGGELVYRHGIGSGGATNR